MKSTLAKERKYSMKIMKKIGLSVLLMFGFAQVSSPAEDYSNMSTNELEKALVAAVKKNDPGAVKQLLQAGANAHQELTYTQQCYDDYDHEMTCTVLQYAALFGYVNIVREFIQAELKSDDINKALILAAKDGDADVVRELIKADTNGGGLLGLFNSFFNINGANKKNVDMALIEAAAEFPGIAGYEATGEPGIIRWVTGSERGYANLKNYLDVIKLLIQAGAHVNHTDEYAAGNTPLIEIIGKTLYTERQKKARAEIIQVLLKAGANVNYANKQGDVALIVAIKKHDFDAVQLLLEIPGININYVDNDGDTPLIIAMKFLKYTYIAGHQDEYDACLNSQNILKILLEIPGINVYHVNKKGDTAIKLLQKIDEKMNHYW